MIANDGILDSQSKSADYYQSSFVIDKKELDLKTSRLYVFNQFKSGLRTSFSIPITFLEFKKVCSFQIQVIQKTQILLYQNLISFIKQSVFVNEIITSNNFYKSLYSA